MSSPSKDSHRTMSISLNPLKALADPIGYDTLPQIDEAARSLTSLKRD